MIEYTKIGLVAEFDSINLDVRTNGQRARDDWIPSDPSDVSTKITLHIGTENDVKRDLFETVVPAAGFEPATP